MARRGFTVVELAIVISVSGLLVPLVYLTGRNFDDQRATGVRHVAVADEVRTVGEALRADRRSLAFSAPGSLVLEGSGACSPITYAVTPAKTLVRRAPAGCGGEAALATQVLAARRARGGLELTFGFEARPDRLTQTVIFIPVED